MKIKPVNDKFFSPNKPNRTSKIAQIGTKPKNTNKELQSQNDANSESEGARNYSPNSESIVETPLLAKSVVCPEPDS